MQKIVFSSDELPVHLDDRERFSLWRELYTARYGRLILSRPEQAPFSVRCDFAHFDGIAFARFAGSIDRVARTSREIAADANSDFCLVMNCGRSRMASFHRGQEAAIGPGTAILFSNGDAGELRGEVDNTWLAMAVPRHRLRELIADAEDLTGAMLDPSSPAMRHLRRYLDIILEPDGIGDDPALLDHIGTTLLDLIALVLGTARDMVQLARMRGLRTARLREILSALRAGFADPSFTVHRVALNLGLSPRYIQDLLQQSGQSFTQRVLELRLQKARAMLADGRCDRMKVIEIAYACGFDGVSYFNHCFRRRFGTSPTQYRGAGDAGGRA